MVDVALSPSAAIRASQKTIRCVPAVDGMLIVKFGHESARVKVVKVLNDDTALVEFLVPPMVNRSGFKVGDVVGARRRQERLREFWEAQSEHDFMAEQKKLAGASRPRSAPPAAPVPAAPSPKAAAKAPTKPKAAAKPKSKRGAKPAAKNKKRKAA